MLVSIKDIANKAKVAPSTVSRALNDHPRIGLETRLSIQKLAKNMGYVRNEAARHLVAQKSGSIGVSIVDLADPFYADITQGIEDTANQFGYQLLMASHKKDMQRELKVVQSFQEKRTEGIIIAFSNAYKQYVEKKEIFVPIVVINRSDFPYAVLTNRAKGATQLMHHLTSLGHKRIAFIRGIDPEGNRDRLKAYKDVLKENKIAFQDKLVYSGDEGIAGGIAAANKILMLNPRPTAVFAYNDRTAIGVIKGLRRSGLRVPEDISVAGFDDLEIAEHYHPSLTTVKQPAYQLGVSAMTMLVNRIQGKDVTKEWLEPELIIRDSTAAI